MKKEAIIGIRVRDEGDVILWNSVGHRKMWMADKNHLAGVDEELGGFIHFPRENIL